MKKKTGSGSCLLFVKAIPHNAARADFKKNDKIRAQFFRKVPQAYCAALL